jgi:hypothetical protein
MLVALAYLGFVSIGLPDGLLGVAWPSIRAYFYLPLDALGALLAMFTIGCCPASAADVCLRTSTWDPYWR